MSVLSNYSTNSIDKFWVFCLDYTMGFAAHRLGMNCWISSPVGLPNELITSHNWESENANWKLIRFPQGHWHFPKIHLQTSWYLDTLTVYIYSEEDKKQLSGSLWMEREGGREIEEDRE